MGAYDQALPLYQRALKIWEKALGPEHPDTATSLNNLAELYQALGAYDQALPLYQRALKIREKALGPEGPGAGAPGRGPGVRRLCGLVDQNGPGPGGRPSLGPGPGHPGEARITKTAAIRPEETTAPRFFSSFPTFCRETPSGPQGCWGQRGVSAHLSRFFLGPGILPIRPAPPGNDGS